MRFAITTSGNGGEQQVTAPATLPTGRHLVTVTINADLDIITLYLDKNQVASQTGATLTPALMGTTTNNWLGRSQYGGDGYFSGSIDEFAIYNATLSPADIQNVYAGIAIGVPHDTDLNADSIINLQDFNLLAKDWLKGKYIP